MIIIGYIAAVLIGLSLGLIGGGGSILTIPVLVYLFKLPPTAATGYSLFIVGSTSLVGAIKKYRQGHVNFLIAINFSITSVLTVFITRKYILPVIPDYLFTIGNIIITKSLAIIVLFAILMITVSLKMILSKKIILKIDDSRSPVIKIILSSMCVGLITGLLGAGGGFMIIPVLILLFHLPMKQAIGTSLLIIALNSLIGFLGDVMNESLNWNLLISLSLISIAGVFIGNKLGEKIASSTLKKGFGWFVLIIGIYIIVKEIFFI